MRKFLLAASAAVLLMAFAGGVYFLLSSMPPLIGREWTTPPITSADVATVLGLSDSSFFSRLISLIAEGDHAAILESVNDAAASGRDFKMLYRDLLFRNPTNPELVHWSRRVSLRGAAAVARAFVHRYPLSWQ